MTALRARRFAGWVSLNASLAALVVVGTTGTEWAWNIARFGIVLFALSTTACSLSGETLARLRAKGSAAPAFMRVTVDLFVVLWLAGTGHFVFAGFHAWQAGLDYSIWLGHEGKGGVSA